MVHTFVFLFLQPESIEWIIEDRLSLCRMIWLLPLSTVSKMYLFLSLPVFRRSSLMKGEGAEGVGAWSFDARKLVLYRSFNTRRLQQKSEKFLKYIVFLSYSVLYWEAELIFFACFNRTLKGPSIQSYAWNNCIVWLSVLYHYQAAYSGPVDRHNALSYQEAVS